VDGKNAAAIAAMEARVLNRVLMHKKTAKLFILTIYGPIVVLGTVDENLCAIITNDFDPFEFEDLGLL